MAIQRTFKGYTLVIPKESVSETLTINDIPTDVVVTSISVVTDKYGVSDSFKVRHVDGNGNLITLLVDDFWSIPRDFSWDFPLPNIVFSSSHKLKLLYTHVSGIELNLFCYLTMEKTIA